MDASNESKQGVVPEKVKEQTDEFSPAETRMADEFAKFMRQEFGAMLTGKDTGRTAVGKRRSRRNAIKHGILASVVTLEGESTEEFDSLLKGLRKDFRPDGTLEQILVEKLATIMWRYRRLLYTESAEIASERACGLRQIERQDRDRKELQLIDNSEESIVLGLMGCWHNGIVRSKVIYLLDTLHTLINVRGFTPDVDRPMLGRIFGVTTLNSLLLQYEAWSNPKRGVIKAEALKEFDLPLAERKLKFLDQLEREINRLKKINEDLDVVAKLRRTAEKETSGVPEAPRLERLLRYSASLERDFDRTLNQLERLQGMRKGQPATPTVNVKLTT